MTANTYKLLDGCTIVASSHSDFVTKLRNTSFFPRESDDAYMADFAKRAYIMFGASVRSDSANDFANDLISLGIVYISQLN